MRVLLALILLSGVAGAQEFSKENLKKTLESLVGRATQAEAAAVAAEGASKIAEEASAAAEAALAESEKGRVSALGYVAEIANANSRLEAELISTQKNIDDLKKERDTAIEQRDTAREEVNKLKFKVAEEKGRADKWQKWCVITLSAILAYFVVPWLIRTVMPI